MSVSSSTSQIIPTSSQTQTQTITTYTNSRSASYALNKDSLVSNLVKDASLDHDILCEFNCGGQNVNVKCSSGFYAAVAKPALSTISEGHSLTVQGIVATVTSSGSDMTDTNGLSVNTLLKISLRTATTPPCNLGSLSIHLHHTTRLVQIQGSFKMPDSTQGPVWFAEHVVLPMFKERGKSSFQHIQGINKAILSLKSGASLDSTAQIQPDISSNKRCGGCLNLFTKRTSPIPCTGCAKYFHKRNCWKSHTDCPVSSLTPPSTSSGLPPPTSSAHSSALPSLRHQGFQRTQSVKRPAANVSYVDIDSDDDPLSPAAIALPSTVTQTFQPSLSLHPDLLQLISGPDQEDPSSPSPPSPSATPCRHS